MAEVDLGTLVADEWLQSWGRVHFSEEKQSCTSFYSAAPIPTWELLKYVLATYLRWHSTGGMVPGKEQLSGKRIMCCTKCCSLQIMLCHSYLTAVPCRLGCLGPCLSPMTIHSHSPFPRSKHKGWMRKHKQLCRSWSRIGGKSLQEQQVLNQSEF